MEGFGKNSGNLTYSINSVIRNQYNEFAKVYFYPIDIISNSQNEMLRKLKLSIKTKTYQANIGLGFSKERP